MNETKKKPGGCLATMIVIVAVVAVAMVVGYVIQKNFSKDDKPSISLPEFSVSGNPFSAANTVPTQAAFSYGTYDSRSYTNDWADLTVAVPSGYRVATEKINLGNGTAFAATDDQQKILTLRITDSKGYAADVIMEGTISNLESRGFTSLGTASTYIQGERYQTASFQASQNGEMIYINVYLRVLEDHIIMIQTTASDVASLREMESMFKV